MNQRNVGSSERAASSQGEGGLSAKSHEAAEQLKGAVVGQVEQARERAESAKEDVARRIQRLALQVRNVGDSLRTDDSLAASVADRTSQSIEGLAGYVSRTDAQSFLRDTEQLARRQPALFFGGAFLLGLTAGRFLKSSGPENNGGRMSDRRRDDDEYYNRKERPSSFLPQGGEGTRSSPDRYRENFDATFGRDVGAQDIADRETAEPRRQTGSGAPPPPDATTSPEVPTPEAKSPEPRASGAKADKVAAGQARKGNAL
jgi:hypothetical protein